MLKLVLESFTCPAHLLFCPVKDLKSCESLFSDGVSLMKVLESLDPCVLLLFCLVEDSERLFSDGVSLMEVLESFNPCVLLLFCLVNGFRQF